ncbi:MAG: helix-turn-helix domain-containing protein [Mesorhizobium sp.]|nr:MAG: helix-turn-helix domain-containing protein [Mesorhizobium sp.]
MVETLSPLLTPKEACAELGVGEDTLRDMRMSGELPYVNIGRGKMRETPRYDLADLLAWKAKRKTTICPSSSEKKPRTARTATSFNSTVADFQAAREKLRSQKQSR